MNKLKDIPKLIEDFNITHNNKYAYDKMVYIKNSEKVIITCPIHGEFFQTPANHKTGSGCKECSKVKISNSKRKTTETIIREFIKVHGDTYSYDKVEYNVTGKKIIITCHIHGDFKQKPTYHKNFASGCPSCAAYKTSYETYKGRPTILYYIKINDLWKIGVCLVDNRFKTMESNILKGRFRGHAKHNLSISIINYEVFEDGIDAYLLEQRILCEFDSMRYFYKNNDMNWFGGYTELFCQDIQNEKDIKSII